MLVRIAIACALVLPIQAQTTRAPGGTPTGPPIVASYATFEGRTELTPVVAPPAALGLAPFYRKYVDAGGIPVVSSEKVRDDALLLARDIINFMLSKRPDVRAVMVERKSRLLIMSIGEGETDLPERSDWKKPAITDRRLTQGERDRYNQPGGIASMTDKQYWDNRARGMGGNITSAAEENLIGLPGTRYFGEHITVHEFSHNVMDALRVADRALFSQIQPAYEAAKFYDGTTGARVLSPGDLKAYDPALYAILDKIYAGHHIPADVYHGKNLRPAQR